MVGSLVMDENIKAEAKGENALNLWLKKPITLHVKLR